MPRSNNSDSDTGATSITGLISVQLELQQQLQRAHKNFKKTPRERLTITYITTRLELLNDCWNNFMTNHFRILQGVDAKVLSDTLYIKEELYYACEEEYISAKSLMLDKINELAPPSTSANSEVNQQKNITPSQPTSLSHEVKIPIMKIPYFNGKYTEWVSFHDQFVSLIHNNSSLSDVQKLHYLKMHVVGEAANVLRNITVTEKNYEHAWNKLIKRFSNTRILVNAYLQKLISIKSINVESSNSIRNLLDMTTDCLSGLKGLDVNTESWDVIIIYLTTSKLDSESLKQWEEKINKDCDESLPTFEQLTEFLEARFRALEGIQSSKTYTHSRQKQLIEKKVFHSSSKEVCSYCKSDHYIFKCKEFTRLSYDDKKGFIEKNRLCFNCLIPRHGVKSCRQNTRCHKCGKRHHTLIHPENNDRVHDTSRGESHKTSPDNTDSSSDLESSPQKISTHFATKSQSQNTGILLATAIIKVRAKNGQTLQMRALIDQGSEGSFITESAAQALGLKRLTVRSAISGLGDNTVLRSKHMISFTLQSNLEDTFELSVNAYVLTTLTRLLPTRRVNVTWPHIQDLKLADPSYGTPGKIDILLGAAVYSRIILDGVIIGPPGSPVAQKTQLGWIISGEINTIHHENVLVNMHIVTEEDNNLLRKFWEIESIYTDESHKIMTEEESQCEKIYKDTYSRDKDGRYIVAIPFRNAQIDYGNTKDIAKKRLEHLEKKLLKDPKLKEEYTKVMMEYLELNHMRELTQEESDTKEKTFYLPHHAVIRQDKSTSKVRIVFDASSKRPNGISLNDNMLVGPKLQKDLRHIIMAWRKHEIAIVADCVKMYRQIKVKNEHTDYQRLLWRVNNQLHEFKLTRVTFGTASAPYLATKTLQQLANDEQVNYPIASHITKTAFYMDDLLCGADDKLEGEEIYRQMTLLMKSGGFQLQKWASNNSEFMKFIEKGDFNNDQAYTIKSDDIVKTLGIAWNRVTDEFNYKLNMPNLETTITKRSILADISRLFDPLGWIAPVITVAKCIIQKLWVAGVKWDEEVPFEIRQEWTLYKKELLNVTRITVGRWLYTNKTDITTELHGYSDASMVAYAAVVYVRVVKGDNSIQVQLVTAKTKVAPIKTVSVPRLELCGAVLLARLLREVATHLDIQLQNIHASTDSSVVLAWLKSHPSRWKTFIANRTSEIIELLPSEHWHHIASEKNPADIASRGDSPSSLSEKKLWWYGPEELMRDTVVWETNKINTTKLEERTVKLVTATTTTEDFDLFERYSTLNKLVRVTAYILRAFKKDKQFSKHLTGEEINLAMKKCILLNQRREFPEEIKRLQNDKPVKRKSKLLQLNPFLDKNGVLRVGGRLENAKVPDCTKHQVILAGISSFTKLVVLDSHTKTFHGGPSLMLSHLRRRFWITHAKSLIRTVVHKCVVCTRYRASTASQMMGALPEVRVKPAKPFLHSGTDLAGPIDLRLSKGRGCKTQKGYLVIFVCMVTRAIHIEIVSSLTTQDFIAAFKRFVARRGHCQHMWSDNATNLVSGNKELIRLFNRSIERVRSDIEELLANDGTTWHHIPASAPHFGGLWEAGVKSIKYHLRRILGNTTLTYEEMSTVTSQIEACLNSRPISPLSDDPTDLTPLTPGHFLIGEAPITVPEETYLDENVNRLDRWQLTQKMLQDFWNRWSSEYLTRLQQRPKWLKKQPNLNVGELVLVKDDNMPPSKWSMARILETHPGDDNLIRVVTIKCRNSVLKRPITKICRLPLDTD